MERRSGSLHLLANARLALLQVRRASKMLAETRCVTNPLTNSTAAEKPLSAVNHSQCQLRYFFFVSVLNTVEVLATMNGIRTIQLRSVDGST